MGGTPPPPFHSLNFKICTESKTKQFLELDTRPGTSFFDGIYDVFCTCLNFFIKKCNFKNYQKITKKSISSWCLAFGNSAPCPKLAPPKGHFWRYLRCFMHIERSSKMSRFCASGGGSAAWRRPPIAKAKATPHANMPGIRCLVHRRI